MDDVLSDLDRRDFYIPGSILRLDLEPGHWLTEGMPVRTIAWFERGLAFEPTADAGDRVQVVGRYGTDEVLLSGWINGADAIAGAGALAVVRQGQGRIVMFGFRPQYRGQTIVSYPLIFNALRRSIAPTPAD